MAQFNPVAADLILVAVQAKTKLPKKPLRQQLQKFEQELGLIPNDLALDIARKIRNEHFNGRCSSGSLRRCVILVLRGHPLARDNRREPAAYHYGRGK